MSTCTETNLADSTCVCVDITGVTQEYKLVSLGRARCLPPFFTDDDSQNLANESEIRKGQFPERRDDTSKGDDSQDQDDSPVHGNQSDAPAHDMDENGDECLSVQ